MFNFNIFLESLCFRVKQNSCSCISDKIYTLTSLQRRVDKESWFLEPRHHLDQVFHERRHHTLQYGGASFGGSTVDYSNFQAIILGHHWNNGIVLYTRDVKLQG